MTKLLLIAALVLVLERRRLTRERNWLLTEIPDWSLQQFVATFGMPR